MDLKVFKTNHEIRFIIGSTKEDCYALKYATKSNLEQGDVDIAVIIFFYRNEDKVNLKGKMT